MFNSIAIATAAMEMLGGKDALASSRTDQIMADAAYVVLTRDSRARTGEFLIDEDVLKDVGVTDFEQYACVPGMLDSVIWRNGLGWGEIKGGRCRMFQAFLQLWREGYSHIFHTANLRVSARSSLLCSRC